MNSITITQSNGWVLVGTGLTSLVIEAKGYGMKLYMGTSAPSASEDASFTLPSGVALSVPVAAHGGGVWVKTFRTDSLKVIYAAA